MKKSEEKGFQFNTQIEEKIRSILSPIQEIIPLTSFGYVRNYRDGRMLNIQPNQRLLQTLLENNAYDMEHGDLKRVIQEMNCSTHYFWGKDSNDELSRFATTLGLKNIMTIFSKNDSYMDAVTFSNSLDDQLGMDLYADNKELYQHFRAYFFDKFNDLIDFNDKEIYFESKLYDYYFDTEKDDILKKDDPPLKMGE